MAGVSYAFWSGWNDPALATFEWGFAPLPVAVGFLLMFATTLTGVPLWVVLYRRLGGSIDAGSAFRIVLISNLGKYLPGKVGHLAGRVLMLKAMGQPSSTVVTSSLVELTLSLLGAAIVGLASLAYLVASSEGSDTRFVLFAQVTLLVLPLGLAGLHPKILGALLRMGSRLMPGGTTLGTELPTFRTVLALLAGYVVRWWVMSIALFHTAQTVYPISWDSQAAMGTIAAGSYLLGLVVPFAPAGIGVREGSMAAMLSTIMPLPAAAAASVLFRVVSILAEVAAAGLAAAMSHQSWGRPRGDLREPLTDRGDRATQRA